MEQNNIQHQCLQGNGLNKLIDSRSSDNDPQSTTKNMMKIPHKKTQNTVQYTLHEKKQIVGEAYPCDSQSKVRCVARKYDVCHSSIISWKHAFERSEKDRPSGLELCFLPTEKERTMVSLATAADSSRVVVKGAAKWTFRKELPSKLSAGAQAHMSKFVEDLRKQKVHVAVQKCVDEYKKVAPAECSGVSTGALRQRIYRFIKLTDTSDHADDDQFTIDKKKPADADDTSDSLPQSTAVCEFLAAVGGEDHRHCERQDSPILKQTVVEAQPHHEPPQENALNKPDDKHPSNCILAFSDNDRQGQAASNKNGALKKSRNSVQFTLREKQSILQEAYPSEGRSKVRCVAKKYKICHSSIVSWKRSFERAKNERPDWELVFPGRQRDIYSRVGSFKTANGAVKLTFHKGSPSKISQQAQVRLSMFVEDLRKRNLPVTAQECIEEYKRVASDECSGVQLKALRQRIYRFIKLVGVSNRVDGRSARGKNMQNAIKEAPSDSLPVPRMECEVVAVPVDDDEDRCRPEIPDQPLIGHALANATPQVPRPHENGIPPPHENGTPPPHENGIPPPHENGVNREKDKHPSGGMAALSDNGHQNHTHTKQKEAHKKSRNSVQYTLQEKQLILREAYPVDAPSKVRCVARKYNICHSSVISWKRSFERAEKERPDWEHLFPTKQRDISSEAGFSRNANGTVKWTFHKGSQSKISQRAKLHLSTFVEDLRKRNLHVTAQECVDEYRKVAPDECSGVDMRALRQRVYRFIKVVGISNRVDGRSTRGKKNLNAVADVPNDL